METKSVDCLAIMQHIRKPLPRLAGSQFYRDKRDRSKHASTLCGAPVGPKDVDIRTAKSKAFRVHSNTDICPVCAQCLP